MNRIILDHGGISELAKKMNVARKTIRRALKGETATPLALKIRHAALKNGGKEYKTVN